MPAKLSVRVRLTTGDMVLWFASDSCVLHGSKKYTLQNRKQQYNTSHFEMKFLITVHRRKCAHPYSEIQSYQRCFCDPDTAVIRMNTVPEWLDYFLRSLILLAFITFIAKRFDAYSKLLKCCFNNHGQGPIRKPHRKPQTVSINPNRLGAVAVWFTGN